MSDESKESDCDSRNDDYYPSDILNSSSECDNDDGISKKIDKKEKDGKIGKVFKYTVSTIEISSTEIFDEYGNVDADHVRSVLDYIINFNNHCFLSFYGGMRENVQLRLRILRQM